MRTTGGLESAATSTRSSPSWSASHLASSIPLIPICPPSGSTSRTSRALIFSLTLGSLEIRRPSLVVVLLLAAYPTRKGSTTRSAALGRLPRHTQVRGRVGGSASALLGCGLEYTRVGPAVQRHAAAGTHAPSEVSVPLPVMRWPNFAALVARYASLWLVTPTS